MLSLRRRGGRASPFYFYRWRDNQYVLEHQGTYQRVADARAEGVRIARRLNGRHNHLHILDQDQCLVDTIGLLPKDP